MKKKKNSIRGKFKKGLATLLTASLVVSAVQIPAFAKNSEEVTESSASVSGIFTKKIVLDLLSEDLKEAALTAIRENRLFDAQDYLGATSDSEKAIREYEAFFNENPGLYVVEVPDSVKDTLSGEADAELRIFVQKDAKKAKVDLKDDFNDLTTEEITGTEVTEATDETAVTEDAETASKDVEFRYGTDKDIILYEPSSDVDTLVNGGEDAVYVDPEQVAVDNLDYELTGNEKITFMFVNESEGTVKFTLNVDGVTYDKVEVGGRKAALKKILDEAGIKKTDSRATASTVKKTDKTEIKASEDTAVTVETTRKAVESKTKVVEEAVETVVSDTKVTETETTETVESDANVTETKTAETEEPDTGANETEISSETGTGTTEASNEKIFIDGSDSQASEVMATEAFGGDDEQSVVVIEETEAETEKQEVQEKTDKSETKETIPEKIAAAIHDVADKFFGKIVAFADDESDENREYVPEEETAAYVEEKETEAVAEAVQETTLAAETEAVEEITSEETKAVVEETTAVETTVAESAMAETTVAETSVTETTATKETEAHVKNTDKRPKVASASEIDSEYDDFAKELIAEVKKAVEENKEAAMECIKVAKIAQYSINELGKVHYETEVDGYTVEVFAPKNAFGKSTPTLNAKKLYKPEEKGDSKDVLSDEEVAELKKNDIYDNSQSLDINFTDFWGKEVEPSEPVKVRITLNDEDLLKKIDASSLEVHHLKETDSTLKTEKVAATEDVKVLDENDEQISEADLKVNPETSEDDEESSAVEVTSAIAEFEVESFSTFTITWTWWLLLATDTYNITVHYVKENGQELTAVKNVPFKDLGDGDVVLSRVQGGVTDYEYKEARLGSATGDVVATVSARDMGIFGHKVDFYNENGKRVAAVDYNTDIFLIYKKTEYPEGGRLDPNKFGKPVAEKKLEANKNNDGTYTLTLSVEGKSESKDLNSGKANVLVVLDVSGSMDENSNGRLTIAKTAINNLAEKLLKNNEKVKDNVQIGLITFSSAVKDISSKSYTSLAAFEKQVNKQKAGGGTNWEAALLEANKYDFKNGYPVYIIFVSDGAPTFRINANGDTSDVKYLNSDFTQPGILDHYGKYRVYGLGDEDPSDICLTAAQTAAKSIRNANKKLYVVNAFSKTEAENHMKSLFDNDADKTNNYFDAWDQTKLNAAFDKICNEITQNISYTNVGITDGITSHTATSIKTSDNGIITSGLKYDVYMTKNGEKIDSSSKSLKEKLGITKAEAEKLSKELDDELKTVKANAAKFGEVEGTPTVDWQVGGANHKLLDGVTYSASFIVWPDQGIFDAVADSSNGKEISAQDQKTIDEGWTTNTQAYVKYSVLNEVTGENNAPIKKPDFELSNPDPINISVTDLGVEKIWQLNNITDEAQKSFVNKDNLISLDLYKDSFKDEENTPEPYISGITFVTDPENSENNSFTATEDKQNNQIIWKHNERKAVAPGILVSVPDKAGDDLFKSPGNTPVTFNDNGTVKKYYVLDEGHYYKFDEKSGNKHFQLEDKVYHPMYVDGVLYNVSISDGIITKMELMVELEKYRDGNTEKVRAKSESGKITATNKLAFDELTVSNTFTGNMSNAQATTFAIYLYEDEAGTKLKTYKDVTKTAVRGDSSEKQDYILSLNNDKGMEKQTDGDYKGAYLFTVTPETINDKASLTITLPADAIYKVVEVKTGTGYEDYDTESAWKKNKTTEKKGAVTDVLKLSEVNLVDYVNKKGVVTPTGFSDSPYPFIALALAGFGALAFLAYGRQRRRLYWD
ncbi:vWA domain-containing protein [Oribacterium sp. WCC10]|uniref:vWA domain-containing protein n=1 Tax=Oribacterium sp. WCC10 TaxID=1855343 RepID=UPI0008E07C6C|nr:vWA domain-containing protein [Oribacterium sp. WCC10]SFG07937.1 von Willebrand factor type A domain-containing protein [Oribacterium sp. WCC10]